MLRLLNNWFNGKSHIHLHLNTLKQCFLTLLSLRGLCNRNIFKWTLYCFDQIFIAERIDQASPQSLEKENKDGEGFFPNFTLTLYNWVIEKVKGND